MCVMLRPYVMQMLGLTRGVIAIGTYMQEHEKCLQIIYINGKRLSTVVALCVQ